MPERLASTVVLVLLCLAATYVGWKQTVFNPAVDVFLTRAAMQSPSAKDLGRSGVAQFLKELPRLTPLTEIESFGPENLSDKIDGKAELYLPAGFREMSCRSFSTDSEPGARIEVFIYDMSEPQGAFAVFSGQRRSNAGLSRLTKDAYFTGNALFFASGSHYVEIIADRESTEVAAAIEETGAAILAALPVSSNGRVDEHSLFPAEGLDPETLRLTASDAFGMEGFDQVFTAEYQLRGFAGSAFVSVREMPDEARELADRYINFLRENGYVDSPAGGAPDGAIVLRLDGFYEVVLTHGRYLYGVHESESLDSAVELARNTLQIIQGKE